MATLNHPRRYYHGKRYEALQTGETVMASFWRWKQENQPTLPPTTPIPIPDDFPLRLSLAEARYTCVQDLIGLDADELYAQGFTLSQANLIVDAVQRRWPQPIDEIGPLL